MTEGDDLKVIGEFELDQQLDLRRTNVTVQSLLDEVFGEGELVDDVDSIVLAPQRTYGYRKRSTERVVYVSSMPTPCSTGVAPEAEPSPASSVAKRSSGRPTPKTNEKPPRKGGAFITCRALRSR